MQMRQVINLTLAIVLALGLTACDKRQSAPIWQEQYDLGVRYLSEGDYEEAIIAFTAAIEIDPKQALAYCGRGEAYVLSDEVGENLAAAQTDFEVAIELNETLADAWLGLANVYILKGDYDKALELLRKGLESTDSSISIEEKIKEIEELIGESSSQYDIEEYDFQTQVTSDGLNVDAENLTVRVSDSRSATITISNLSLKDSYLTNLSTSNENAAEYSWTIEMYGDQEAYSVSTASWAFAPGEETSKSLAEMQHSVWASNGTSWSWIGDAEMSYTPNSITWVFTVSEEYPFDFSKVNRYEVSVYDISLNLSLRRVYTLN